jgi:hypothetical protein
VGKLACKIVEEHLKNLSLLTTPRSILSEKKQMATTTTDATLTTTAKKIGMIM